jgi:hypothetical protein
MTDQSPKDEAATCKPFLPVQIKGQVRRPLRCFDLDAIGVGRQRQGRKLDQ